MHIKQKLMQANKEARWALGITLCYLIGWVIFAYLPPNTSGPLGFPLWFELACIYLPIVFVIVIYWVIKIVFQEVELEQEEHHDE